MSQYRAQFISRICCCYVYADKYIEDMVMHMKSEIRKLSKVPFSLQLRILDSYGKEHVLETDTEAGFQCPEALYRQRCTELLVEVLCVAACEPEKLQEVIHMAITESAEENYLTPFFFREETE